MFLPLPTYVVVKSALGRDDTVGAVGIEELAGIAGKMSLLTIKNLLN
jgi:hypothetical protein